MISFKSNFLSVIAKHCAGVFISPFDLNAKQMMNIYFEVAREIVQQLTGF